MSRKLPNPANLSHDDRMAHRAAQLRAAYHDREPETLEDGSAIYTADEGERFYLRVFAGKALRECRAISGYYRSAEERTEAIRDFIRARDAHQTRKLLRRQVAQKPHTLKIGDILSSSWGWEQTNVEFYQVVVVSKASVTLRQIAASIKQTGYMSGETLPCPDTFIGEPFQRRVSVSNWVRISNYAAASPWNGRPQYVSWYG